MTKVLPPSHLSRSERAAFRKLVAAMASAGLNAEARAPLAADLVLCEARILTLRAAEDGAADPKARGAATRALNVALAEKRRLHAELWKGARPKQAPAPQTKRAQATGAQREADDAWRALFAGKSALTETQILRRHGGPSWAALLYRDAAEEADGEAAVDAYIRRQNRVATP